MANVGVWLSKFGGIVATAVLAVVLLGVIPTDDQVATSSRVGKFKLGDTLVVDVGEGDWKAFEASLKPDGAKAWGLFLGGRFVPACAPAVERLAGAPPLVRIRFVLARVAANRDAWRGILQGELPQERTLRVEVGTPDRTTLLKLADPQVVWSPAHGVQVWVMLGLITLLVTLALRLARTTPLLRDAWPQGTSGAAGGVRPLSLARTQMFFWTLNALAAFLLLWALAGDADTLTGSMLLLMGMSLGTTGIAGAIDASKRQQAATLPAERAALATQAAAASTQGSGTAAAPEAAARIATIDAQIARLPDPARPATAEGWWTDLVSDGDGPAVHRLQHVLWTIALGVVFWGYVLRNLSMPDFDATLLALMGVSSGGYLLLKAGEKAA